MASLPKKYKVELKEEVKISDEVLVEGLLQSVELLRKSSEEIRNYLEEHKEESNPGSYETLLLNAILSQHEALSRANEALARILERTRQLEGISRNLWIIIGQASVIIALMISILPKLATI